MIQSKEVRSCFTSQEMLRIEMATEDSNCHATIHVTILLLSNVMPYTMIQLISSLQHIEFTFPSNNIVKSELHPSVEKVNFEHQGVFYNHSLMLRNEILYAFSYTMLCNCQ